VFHLLQHLLFLFECLVQSFDGFQEHFLRLPCKFIHFVSQETAIIQENFPDYLSL